MIFSALAFIFLAAGPEKACSVRAGVLDLARTPAPGDSDLARFAPARDLDLDLIRSTTAAPSVWLATIPIVLRCSWKASRFLVVVRPRLGMIGLFQYILENTIQDE